MQMVKRVPLNENEQKVLQTLARKGVMSPSQVSAETWILPGETRVALETLQDAGLVLVRDDSDSVDGKLAAITVSARDLLGADVRR